MFIVKDKYINNYKEFVMNININNSNHSHHSNNNSNSNSNVYDNFTNKNNKIAYMKSIK